MHGRCHSNSAAGYLLELYNLILLICCLLPSEQIQNSRCLRCMLVLLNIRYGSRKDTAKVVSNPCMQTQGQSGFETTAKAVTLCISELVTIEITTTHMH